jgi:uncharacterized protein
MNVTLITGASSGIGEALAYQLAAKKQPLVLVARNEQKLREICAKTGAQYIVADLSKPDAPNFVFEECGRRGLIVEALVNNAGIGSSGEFVHNDLSSELAMLQLNNASLVALCRLFLPGMAAARKGSIINVASLAAFSPVPYMAAYAASKAFVRSFTLALTEECKPYGVYVMLFSPGLTTTNFMNTAANNNAWGKTLTSGANTQTSEEVAAEMIRAWDRKKNTHVSGRMNAFTAKMTGLIPAATIARMFANMQRKKMKV